MTFRRISSVGVLAAALAVASYGGFRVGLGGREPRVALRVASVGLLPDTLPTSSALRDTAPDEDMPPVDTYQEALDTIHQRYYGSLPKSTEYTTDQLLTYAAIRGMLGSLGDRYTRFLTPGEYRDMMDENHGEFSGIGARLDARASQVIVVDTIEGSPARKAGLKPGDHIVKVDNTVITSSKVDDAVKLIRGERGTAVALTVERKGVKHPLVFHVVRDIVEFDNVVTQVLPGNIGYMSLSSFNDQSDRRVGEALGKLQAKKVRGLIFDLRWNPGGLLEQAVAISSRFVHSGPIVWIKERGGKPESMDAIRVKRSVGHIPVVILINKYSASASEIVSGAIKDTKSGTLVGSTTWGKGLVQTINPIATDNSAVLITTHRYYTPAMVDINKKGIAPDVFVNVTDKDFAKVQQTRKLMDDPQIAKGVAVLQAKLRG
ncbi:MAG TPA: S41 family peptidase [Armatimonadota bacterium]|jgi:carboxyl-terminal processing protease